MMHFSIGFVAEYTPSRPIEDVCAIAHDVEAVDAVVCDVEEVDCEWLTEYGGC